MSLPVPLTVRLVTVRANRNITRDVHDLRFAWSVPGGYSIALADLDRPLALQPDEIAYYARLVVYDARTGEVVWDGRVEDLGRSGGPDGQVWRLAAVGPAAHAADRTIPYVAIDRDLTRFRRVVDVHTPGANDSIGDDPGGSGAQAIVMQFPAGTAVDATSRCAVRYNTLANSSQKLARVSYTWDAGRTDANFQVESVARSSGGSNTASSVNWNTAGGTVNVVIVTNWTAGRDTLDLAIDSDVAGTPTADDHWASIRNLVIRATLFNSDGSERLAAADYTTDYVLASDIVKDWLGRHHAGQVLPFYDGAGATVETTAYQIDQFARPDGANARDVFADLMALEPGYYWAAWEQNSADLHRFEWVAWPDAVRYEASIVDGLDSPASADGLWNAVQVRGRDAVGDIKFERRTSSVQVMSDAGLTREPVLDLGDEVWSVANAQRAGDEFLAEHATVPNTGQLVVAHPILDLQAGRMVQPWEIRPGLIRVRGLLPRADGLNATTRDGVTTFRVVGCEYTVSRAAAVLDLDSTPRTVTHALAQLQQRPQNRRR